MATVKTKAPTGLSITRSQNNFTLTWKIGDANYGAGQALRFRSNDNSWQNVTIANNATSKTCSVTLSLYYPAKNNPLSRVQFAVRGTRSSYTERRKTIKPVVSDWAFAEFAFQKPPAPTLSIELNSSVTNEATWSWSVASEASDHVLVRDIEWQSVLMKECNIEDSSKANWSTSQTGWRTGTTGATGTVTITEDTSLLANASYTRLIRVRTRGVAGASAWAYGRHTYSRPYTANIKTADAVRTRSDGYQCTVKWAVENTPSHPIDKVVVQYAFATPTADFGCPDGTSWTDAGTVKDTKSQSALTFSVDNLVGADQCLFVRVNTQHDNNITYSSAEIADVGYLSDPTGLVVSNIDPDEHRATVTATNNSAVPNSFLAIYCKYYMDPDGFIMGIIPHGATSVSVEWPSWIDASALTVGVKAYAGTYRNTRPQSSVYIYNISADMQSQNMLTYGGTVPATPSDVILSMTDIPGTIHVEYDWLWREATVAEISWADHADAWESTDQPDTFLVSNTHASAWNISGLETGITWYVRIRLGSGDGDNITYGAYSDIVSIDLSSAPVTPVLTLSDAVITADGEVTASWVYVSTDTTAQASAEVAEVVNGAYVLLDSLTSAQYATISAKGAGWDTGEEHQLAVRVTSASGRQTGWSDPVTVYVAEPITCEITQTSLVEMEPLVDGVTLRYNALTVMPLTVTVVGAGTGLTTLAIVRAETYHIERPDESDVYGFEGETVALISQNGEAQITINRSDLLGRLDDGAAYMIIATVQDTYGQTAFAEIPFKVEWAHQAVIPGGQVTVDAVNLAAKLKPIKPTGAGNSDTCDIYRLSVDKPQLVCAGATYGQTYVDPYPAVGEYSGYRFVMVTVDGDYITADHELAWVDVDCIINSNDNIIDFDGGRVLLSYNPDVSNSWKKDFKETKYLGGSVQGDWNPAVSRTSSVNSVAIVADDAETIETMRRLATYTGICHVRTRDGSSYAADVQVSESYAVSNGHKLANFTLSITRIDPEGLDGMTLAEWNALHQEA